MPKGHKIVRCPGCDTPRSIASRVGKETKIRCIAPGCGGNYTIQDIEEKADAEKDRT